MTSSQESFGPWARIQMLWAQPVIANVTKYVWCIIMITFYVSVWILLPFCFIFGWVLVLGLSWKFWEGFTVFSKCIFLIYDTTQKRSTEGCSKFKSPETRQVQEYLYLWPKHIFVTLFQKLTITKLCETSWIHEFKCTFKPEQNVDKKV